jgi:hypothetical protein
MSSNNLDEDLSEIIEGGPEFGVLNPNYDDENEMIERTDNKQKKMPKMKIGYDETNFTNAIVDLGKCENQNEDLNRQILELKQTIKDLNVYKVGIESLLHNSRIGTIDKRQLDNIINRNKDIARQEQQRQDTIETKKEKIKECFMTKGLIDYIPKYELERLRFNLDNYVNYLATNDNFVKNNGGIVELRKIYNNLKQKYEEAPKILEKILNKQLENPMFDPLTLANDQREIYDRFVDGYPTWFPNSPDPLGQTVFHYIKLRYSSDRGLIYNYRDLIAKIRDLLECWILTISLLVPNIEKVGGTRRKSRTRRSKMNKRGQSKSRKNHKVKK